MEETYTIEGYQKQEEATGSRKLTEAQVNYIVSQTGTAERTRNGFIMSRIDSSNPSIPIAIDLLLEYGCDLHDGRPAHMGGVRINRVRDYSAEDLKSLEYIEIDLKERLGRACTLEPQDENGLPKLRSPITPISVEYGTMDTVIGGSPLIVRGHVKNAIEEARFENLLLIEARVTDDERLSEKERAWFVWSSHILPPANNLCHSGPGALFKYIKDESYPECLASTGYLQKAELYYKREIVKRRSFDVGITFEKFGPAGRSQRRVVYSRKFADFLQELGVRIKGYPVHLVDTQSPPWIGPYPEPLDHLNTRPAWLDQYA